MDKGLGNAKSARELGVSLIGTSLTFTERLQKSVKQRLDDHSYKAPFICVPLRQEDNTIRLGIRVNPYRSNRLG